jgi:transposase
MTIGGQDDCC